MGGVDEYSSLVGGQLKQVFVKPLHDPNHIDDR